MQFSSSYSVWKNNTDRNSVTDITKTTIQSTTRFVFQIPNNSIIDQDFKSANFDTTTIGGFTTSKAEISNDSIHVNQQVYQPSNEQQRSSSNTYQEFTTTVRSDQSGYNAGDNSHTTTTMYQLDFVKCKIFYC